MNASGFTLLELLITTVIVAILATIAIPSYTSYVVRTHRIEAQIALLNLVAEIEAHYTEHHTYATATITDLNGTDQSQNKYYILGLTDLTIGTYTLTATPNGHQGIQDTNCQTLTINQLGEKGITSGPAGIPTGTIDTCWPG
jgi:type IV pilus assembly protein PilE